MLRIPWKKDRSEIKSGKSAIYSKKEIGIENFEPRKR